MFFVLLKYFAYIFAIPPLFAPTDNVAATIQHLLTIYRYISLKQLHKKNG